MNAKTPLSSPRIDAAVMALAVVLPTLVTLVYFVVLADAPAELQQSAYGIGKTVQFLLPIVWVFFVRRESFRWTWPSSAGMLVGSGFGMAVLAAMMALYHLWLKPVGYMDVESSVAQQIQEKVTGFGISSAVGYWGLGTFYALRTPDWKSTTGGGSSSGNSAGWSPCRPRF